MQDKTLKYFLDNKNFPETYSAKESKPTPTSILQVVDGEIVLNETGPAVDTENEIVTSYTYMTKKCDKTRWNLIETSVFYKAIECCGCDFSMINLLFPKRDRSNIKQKYKKESKINPKRIENAISNFKEFSLEKFNRLKEDLV